ncbi:cold-shock protein [Yunchengibacter salinarum]|uniref:cold-shock protein n=1 Tax=Yunchengibacter salinarum TaxID=3133399 RepID=UPI0035B64390
MTLFTGNETLGTVKWFNADKGFGFIQPDTPGDDIFVHLSAVRDAGWQTLNEEQRVAFRITRDDRGRQRAVDLKMPALKV